LHDARAGVSLQADMAEQRKSNSRATIDRLKDQMEKLSAVTALNPKGMARILNGMARELEAAVRDYAQAGDGRDQLKKVDAVDDRTRSLQGLGGPSAVELRERSTKQEAVVQADKNFLSAAENIQKRLDYMFGDSVRAAVGQTGKDDRETQKSASGFARTRDAAASFLDKISGRLQSGKLDLLS
jgi:hypothetical protein